MKITPEVKRKPTEDLNSYLIRLGDNLELYELTWTQVAELLNEECGEEYSEAKWRKDYASYLRWKEFLTEKLIKSDEYIKEIEDASLNLQKEKVKFQDQKREFNNLVRKQARFEHLKEEINKAILEVSKQKPLVFKYKNIQPSRVRANVLWSDWHYGMDFSNSLNTYNPEVFRERVEILVSKIIEYGLNHNVDTLTVGALGDFVSGLIHVSTRVEANENIIKQIQVVSEVFAESLAELSKHFRFVRFINIIGNHARLIPNKTESIFTENLENLIPWYLESRLKDFKNIEIYRDVDGYFVDKTFDPAHVYVHGDLDNVSNVAKNLPQILGIVPRYIFAGHIHHDTVKEYGRTKVITNGSLIGSDSYAMANRFYAEPMQKMHIFNEKGNIEYTIDITFDE